MHYNPADLKIFNGDLLPSDVFRPERGFANTVTVIRDDAPLGYVDVADFGFDRARDLFAALGVDPQADGASITYRQVENVRPGPLGR